MYLLQQIKPDIQMKPTKAKQSQSENFSINQVLESSFWYKTRINFKLQYKRHDMNMQKSRLSNVDTSKHDIEIKNNEEWGIRLLQYDYLRFMCSLIGTYLKEIQKKLHIFIESSHKI